MVTTAHHQLANPEALPLPTLKSHPEKNLLCWNDAIWLVYWSLTLELRLEICRLDFVDQSGQILTEHSPHVSVSWMSHC